MTITDLIRLAEKATKGPADLIAALSPEVVIALARVCAAAKGYRDVRSTQSWDQLIDALRALDTALGETE